MLLSSPDSAFCIVKRFSSSGNCKSKRNAVELLKLSEQCIANNYCALPVLINRGKGVYLFDANGKQYLDFISGYCALSLGHGHPRLCRVIADQVAKLANTSRAVVSRALVEYGEYVTELFCYEKVLPMNTGNDACETAVKLARKWGYKVKGIPINKAKVLFAENNFWGSSIAAASASTDPIRFNFYGPFVPNFETIPFNDVETLAQAIKDPDVCAFMVEPIQGEAGVIIPDPCYLKQVRELCCENRVLMIADEVQVGLGRAGALLCCQIYKIRPDILVLGKALTGGFMPVSAVLADGCIMDVMEPGTHESTYGGNPLGCAVATEALKVLQEENLIENSRNMGEVFRRCLCDLPRDIVCEVRGVGLLNAIVLNSGINAKNICIELMKQGLLVIPPRGQIIRLCPPLTVREKEIVKASKIIRHTIENSRGSCGEGDIDFRSDASGNKDKKKKFKKSHEAFFKINLPKKLPDLKKIQGLVRTRIKKNDQ